MSLGKEAVGVRKAMLRCIAVAAVVSLTSGCYEITPAATPPPSPTRFVRASYDTTWARVIQFFAENRIGIETIEKASGIIVSTPFELRDQQIRDWADCGFQSGRPVAHTGTGPAGLLNVLASFNVFVRDAGDSSAVRVNVGMTGRVSATTPVRCVTTGAFERLVAEQIASRTATRLR